MLRIQIDLAEDRDRLYREALRRLRGIEIVEDSPDAIIATSVEHECPVLLDQPEIYYPRTMKTHWMPAHEWRFLPNILPVHECREAGKLGDSGLLRIHHWLPGEMSMRQAAFPQVDLVLSFFGTTAEVSHLLTRPDYLQIHLGFPGDGMAMIDIATNRLGLEPYYSMHLIGSDGAAYADDHRNAQLQYGTEGTRAIGFAPNSVLAMQRMLDEFIAGVRAEREWRLTGNDSASVLQILKEVEHA